MENQGDNGNAATAAMDFLASLVSLNIGISYVSEPRNDGIGNGALLRIHAEDGVTRATGETIYRNAFPNDEKIKECGQKFAQIVAKHLKRVGVERTKKVNVYSTLEEGQSGPRQLLSSSTKSFKPTKAKEAQAAAAEGLRAIAKIYTAAIQKNLEEQSSNGMRWESVLDDYAEKRFRENGVAPSVVFFRTGQLANAIKSGKYILKMGKDRGSKIFDK